MEEKLPSKSEQIQVGVERLAEMTAVTAHSRKKITHKHSVIEHNLGIAVWQSILAFNHHFIDIRNFHIRIIFQNVKF